MIIDTSVLVALERRFAAGDEGVLTLLEEPFIAAIEIAELQIGVLMADTDSRRTARARFAARVREHCRVIPFGELESERMASIYVELRRRGTPIGDHDLQIAATALVHGHSVMTANAREFGQVPGLILTPVP